MLQDIRQFVRLWLAEVPFDHRGASLKEGINFLPKTFEPQRLLTTIRQALAHNEGSNALVPALAEQLGAHHPPAPGSNLRGQHALGARLSQPQPPGPADASVQNAALKK